MRETPLRFLTFLLALSLLIAGPPSAILCAQEAGQDATLGHGDENYRALRDAAVGESFTVQDLRIRRDVGIFQLRSGTISFLTPVLDRVTMAVFSGDGSFVLEPNLSHEVRNLTLLTGEQSVQESFQQAVFWFTDETAKEIREHGEPGSAPQASDVLRKFRSEMRERREKPRSSLEAMMTSEMMDNVEADILTALYDPGAEPFFNALILGKRYSHLRFHLRPTGAVPDMMTTEEVALINLAPEKQDEGILYLAPAEGRPERAPDIPQSKHRVDVTHYRIDSELAGNRDLSGSTTMAFKARYGGDRVLKLSLLPTLRVSAVTLGGDQPLAFIQEPEEEDASLYVIFSEPLEKDREYELTVTYEGDKVVYDYGGGNFAVGARTSWYPSVNTFSDPATFELTFVYPKKGTLVSVGNRVEEKTEGKTVQSQWRSDIPLKVAGFNYGRYKQENLTEEQSGYEIEAFATTEVPDFLRSTAGSLPGTTSTMPSSRTMTPSSMLKKAAAETHASIFIFNRFFGKAPYGRIAVTQQPQFSFGQSWPTLVYLPVSAFLDSTHRWMLLGANAFEFSDFIQEITPHEVAHQWWGHMVGWSSYHDQWLSEGFSDFSASLFVQAVNKEDKPYLDFLRHWREAILEKNEFGFRANDVGPIWMGRRLRTARTSSAYSKIVYAKGGFVLHMLRRAMYDQKTGDERFVKMMHDFVQTHLHQNATTQSFQQTVERHMTPEMNLDGDGKMDWFFEQWVYGTEIPSYQLDYSLEPQSDGTVVMKGAVTQKGVSDGFKAQVPVYLTFDKTVAMLGRAVLEGSSTAEPFEIKLPRKPDAVSLNSYYDVLADEVVVNGG